jgi:hypothetical protein
LKGDNSDGRDKAMRDLDHEALEAWAMRSKWRAVLYLLGLAAFISAGLVASVSVLATIAAPEFLHAVAAHTE